MLEWTGERFVPWVNDPTLAYEHLHRYFYASRFAQGKVVLDLASGEGYGSNLLARIAQRVIGVDIAVTAVEHARSRYTVSNLQFIAGSVTCIPLADHSFDLIVCFEAIEHIEDQQSLLSEVLRLLKPDGVFIVSTPNKPVYDQANAEENEFHVKELEFPEFRQLLESRFQFVRYLGQRVFAQSNIWPMSTGDDTSSAIPPNDDFLMDRHDSEFSPIPSGERTAMYHIAVASHRAIEHPAVSSVLVDNSNALLQEKDRQIADQDREFKLAQASAAKAIDWYTRQLQDRDESIRWLESESQSLRNEMAAQRQWYEKEIAHRDATIGSHEEALKWRAEQVQFLEHEKADLIARLTATSAELSRISEQLEAIHASSGWKLILRLRHLRDKLMPAGSPQRRVLQALLRR
jgi:ubiquinone/menaquinone biosynthesis C-methylase UbiE